MRIANFPLVPNNRPAAEALRLLREEESVQENYNREIENLENQFQEKIMVLQEQLDVAENEIEELRRQHTSDQQTIYNMDQAYRDDQKHILRLHEELNK